MKRTEIEFKTKILKCGREDGVNKNETTSQGHAVEINSFKWRPTPVPYSSHVRLASWGCQFMAGTRRRVYLCGPCMILRKMYPSVCVNMWQGTHLLSVREVASAQKVLTVALEYTQGKQERQRNDCCRGKAVIITYECGFVALVIQHSKRKHRIILSHVDGMVLQYF
jgi:hypothetical protein